MVVSLEVESLRNMSPVSALLTYAVIVVWEDEPQIAAAVERANGVSAGSVATGVSLTLINIYKGEKTGSQNFNHWWEKESL